MNQPVLPNVLKNFAWSAGIEDTFIPQERPGLRALEEYELTQHYAQWRADLERAASLGIKTLRWGVPWYRVERQPGVFDWSWVDEVLDYMINQLGVTPIVDLVHYGTPDWLEGSFADPTYPERVASYAKAFAERYSHIVSLYTALNEPTVNADFAGRRGEWPPYLTGNAGYVSVLLPIARGMQLTIKAIKEVQPNAFFVAVEAMRRSKALDERSIDAARLAFHQDLLCFDLVSGKVSPEHPLWQWLTTNGASDDALAQLADNGVEQDVLGVNFYPWSYTEFATDTAGNTTSRAGTCDGSELEGVLKDVYGYTGKPLMVTETSATGTFDERKSWMDDTIYAVGEARLAGIPVVGYTWFPLFTMIGWEYRASGKPVDQHLLHLGLWDCNFDEQRTLVREETPMVAAYREYVKQGDPEGPCPAGACKLDGSGCGIGITLDNDDILRGAANIAADKGLFGTGKLRQLTRRLFR